MMKATIFSVNLDLSGLEYGLESDHALSHAVANAILEGCDNAGYPKYS